MLGSPCLAGLALPCYGIVWMATYAATARKGYFRERRDRVGFLDVGDHTV
jgi:hypothetical protein